MLCRHEELSSHPNIFIKSLVSLYQKPQHCERWRWGFLGIAVDQPRVRFHKRALSKRIRRMMAGCPTSSSEKPEHISIAMHTCVHITHTHTKTVNKRRLWKLEEHVRGFFLKDSQSSPSRQLLCAVLWMAALCLECPSVKFDGSWEWLLTLNIPYQPFGGSLSLNIGHSTSAQQRFSSTQCLLTETVTSALCLEEPHLYPLLGWNKGRERGAGTQSSFLN